ncbi:hypothetical protein [Streptomyces cinereoruber]|uniref:hypothetical protein n=1 Tax=Streptomyces cinereoruber TaxID=67260 RepID=UPI003C2D92AF
MARRLRGYVHVDGRAYGPDDELSAAVAKRIGDHAFEDTGGEVAGESGPETVGFTDPRAATSSGDTAPPPRSGRGSGIDAWRKYAEDNGVEYDTHASREEIIAAAEQAGLIEPEQPTE